MFTPGQELTEMEQHAIDRFHQQIKIFTHVIDEKTDTTLGVFFGPVPHPATASEGYEPSMYQVVWQGDEYAKPPNRKSRSLFQYTDGQHQIQIYLPGSHIETSKLIRYLWQIDLMIPGYLN